MLATFEDRFGRVLHPERNIRNRVDREVVAVDLFQHGDGFERLVVILVPHGEFGDEHVAHGGSGAVARGFARADEGQCAQTRFEVLDQRGAGRLGRHARQFGHAVEHFVVGDVVRVEGHVAEEARQQVVVERAQHLGFGHEAVAVLFVDRRILDARHGHVAVHDAAVAVGPHVGAEAGLRRRDVELRVLRSRCDVHQVGDAFGGDHHFIGVEIFQGYITRVHRRLTLGLGLIEVAGGREPFGVLLQ